ncbi:Ig-like domain-containing protein [Pantoea sp. USHLN256]|uniref:Ig-like domain-containing protein n=1 Tax=Pantoea sp. USHLN256 TaxID=3081293 RepID=UPI003018595E
MKINKLFDPIETVVVEFATGKIAFESREDARDPEEAGVVVHIIINDQHFSTIIEADGNWHWTAPEDLPDGTYNAVMYNVDKGGLQSEDYTPLSIVVDTKPPVAPTLLNLFDDVGETGSFDKGGITDDTRPTLTGVAQKGTTVYLLDEAGNKLGSAVADKESGIWTIEPTTDLKEGVNSLRLRSDEMFANKLREGVVSDAFVINVEGGTPQPVTVEITGAEDNFGTATGDLENGAITDDQTPILKGTVTGGDTVTVYYRLTGTSGAWIPGGAATVTGNSWSWEAGSNIAAGKYDFEARNGDVSSAQFVLELATGSGLSTKTTIVDAWDDVGTTGKLTSGAITDDFTPTLRGRGEANSVVYLVAKHALEGTKNFTAQVDASGNWKFTPDNNLTTGSWSFQVKKDASATPSTAFKLILERNNASGPEIESGKDDFGTPKDLISGDSTDDLTPKLIGTGTANTTIKLRATSDVGSMDPVSVKVNQYGDWSWSPTADMAQGNWKFEVKKEGGTRWESAFDLTLKSGNSSSGILDFETLLTGGGDVSPISEKRIINDDFSTLSGFSGARTEQLANVIEINNGPASFGDHALRTPYYVAFLARGHETRKPVPTKFSVDIYNPNSVAIEYIIRASTGSDGNNFKSITVTLLPGKLTTVSDANFPSLDFSVGLNTLIFNENLSYPSGHDIWLDNFRYELSTRTSSSLFSEDNDAIHTIDTIDDLTSSAIIGHEGQTDELYLTGHDQLLDLSAHSAEIQSIEVFDISGDGDNTLVVDINSLLQHGEKDLFIDDGKTQLLVRGDAGDTVQLKDILPEGSDVSEWVHQDGTVTVAGVEYNVYSHGDDAELLIQQGVKTELV